MIRTPNLPATQPNGLRPKETNKSRRARAAQAAEDQQAARLLNSEARAIKNETRLTALQADAALALGGHIAEGVVDLDLHRRHLAKDDITLNLLLAEIESETVQQVKRIQRSLFNELAL